MEAEAARQSRLIGAILVENGLITRDQLVRALEIQEETGEKLGEIVVAEFAVPRIELASVLAEQWAAIDGTSSGRTVKPAAALRVVPVPRQQDPAAHRPIGEMFLELGLITQEQLDAALERQRMTGERIGEVLVEQGSLTRLGLASALAEQWSSLEKLRPPSPEAKGPDSPSDSRAGVSSGTSDAVDGSVTTAYEDRLTAIEGAMATASPGTAELEAGLSDLRASLTSLEARIEAHASERLTSEDLSIVAATLGTRIAALEGRDPSEAVASLRLELDDLRSRPDLIGAVAELRAMVERLGGQPGTPGQIETLTGEVATLSARLDEIVGRIPPQGAVEAVVEHLRGEPAESEEHTSIADMRESIAILRASIVEIESVRVADALAAGSRFAGVERALGRLASQESVDCALGELRAEILAALAVAPTSQQDLDAAAATHVEWVRSELAALAEAGVKRASRLEESLAAIEVARVTSEKERSDLLDASVASIRSALREHQLALDPQLEAQSVELATLRAQVAELQADRAARAERESCLEDRISGEIAAYRGEVGSLGTRIDEMLGRRHTDIQAARAVDERLTEQVEALAARLEDEQGATRSVIAELSLELASVAESLRVGTEAARLGGEEVGSQLAELERLAASVGCRLERIEESLAVDETATLRTTVERLDRQVEEQAALREEQARATERALRKGLASLGERFVDTESAYVEAGNTLRRSIERLGAAVVEADARMADQIPVSPLEGCVAFAPTAAGYRLIELPGAPPEVGAVVELVAGGDPLVVTRYGRSPLPFDGRPCAYLDRG